MATDKVDVTELCEFVASWHNFLKPHSIWSVDDVWANAPEGLRSIRGYQSEAVDCVEFMATQDLAQLRARHIISEVVVK